MLNNLLGKFNNYLVSELGLNEEKIAVANYGLQTIIYTMLGFLIVFMISTLLGVTKTAMAAMLAAALLRNFSGGAHCSTPIKCLMLTSVIFPVLGMFSIILTPMLKEYIIYSIIIVSLFGLLSVLVWAPVDTPNKPISLKKQKKQLKSISIIVLLVLIILLTLLGNDYLEIKIAVQLGVLWQSLMLWPFGIGLIKKYDQINIKKEGINDD